MMEDMDYSAAWRSALDSQLPVLQENLLLNDYFYAFLIQRRIFTQDTIEEIKSESSSDAKILRLVGYLKKRDNTCFDNFLSILESTNNRFIQEIIDQSIRSFRLNRSRENTKSSEQLKLKDRHIEELEEQISDLTRKLIEAEQAVKTEMDRSNYYMEVITKLTAVRPMATQSISVEEMELEMDGMVVEMDRLKDQVEELESQLQWTREDLGKTKHQLDNIIESEKTMKRSLGLRDDAEEAEVMVKIQEMKCDQAQLKKARNELNRITEMRDVYKEKLWKLTQDVKKMDAEKRQKSIRLQRMKRNKDDQHIIQTARSIINEGRHGHPTDQRVLEQMNLPRIDIGTRLRSARNGTTLCLRLLSPADDPPNRPQLQKPNSSSRGGGFNIPSNAPVYCVLCRSECYAHEPCRIHIAAMRNGRFCCCQAAVSGGRVVGCRTMQGHLYVQFYENECRLYDQQGKRLRLRSDEEDEGNAERIAFLSGR